MDTPPRKLAHPLAALAAIVAAGLLAAAVVALPRGNGSPTGRVAEDIGVALPDRGDGSTGPATSEADPDGDAPGATPVTCSSEAGPVPCVASVAAFTIGPRDAVEVLDPGIVVAGADGVVRLHGPDGGAARWRVRLPPPLQVHGVVAGTIAIGSAEGVHFLDAEQGTEIGVHRSGVLAGVEMGPWLATEQSDGSIAAVAVTGEPSWVRAVPPSGRAWLTCASPFVEDGEGLLRSLYPNTGGDRWAVEVPGSIAAIHGSEQGRVVVLDDPPAILVVDDDGEVLGSSPLEGDEVTWSGLHPAGDRVVTVTRHAAAFSTVSVVSVATGEIVVTAQTRGRTGEVAPVLAGDIAAIPLVGARPQLRLIDLATGGLRGLYSRGAPYAGVGLPDAGTVAVLDDRGTLTVHSVDPQHERYRISFGRDAALLAGDALRVRTDVGLATLDAHAGT